MAISKDNLVDMPNRNSNINKKAQQYIAGGGIMSEELSPHSSKHELASVFSNSNGNTGLIGNNNNFNRKRF